MSSNVDVLVGKMLGVLAQEIPPEQAPFEPTVTAVSIAERPLGVGNRRGNERRGPWGSLALKGLHLEGEVRFQLWGNNPTEADVAVLKLHQNLLAAGDRLRGEDYRFLRVAATETSLAEHVDQLDAWRKTASFSVLYEHQYRDSDGALSLIARIPIDSDPESETTVVTDEMVRWDRGGAPALRLQGPGSFGRISALAHLPATPAGRVTLLRTFDGATGAPAKRANLDRFLKAVSGPAPAKRHVRVRFPSVSPFLAALDPGDSVTLGDGDGGHRRYDAGGRILAPPVILEGPRDRLEMSYQGAAFGPAGVLYLRFEKT